MDHYTVEKFKNKLTRIRVSDYHGLNSPGLTCYLNSVLQVLFMTDDFREAIKGCCDKEPTSIDPDLGSLFDNLEKQMTQTHPITRTLGITDVYMQRDAAEYFEKILCLTSPEASKIFKGELNHRTTCLRCKERNDCRSFFWTLPLAMENSSGQIYSVEKGLKAFFKEEKVCGDNQIYCDRCNKKQNADFECEMTQNPEILTLLLKRFSFDYRRGRYVKLHCDVDVPQTLRMESCTYHLYALVNHVGDLMRGHYTAHIKSFETGAWYHFDDCTVNSVKPPLFAPGKNSLRSSTVYLLMYRKVNRNPQKNDEGDREAHFAHSDVGYEGRHDEAERGQAPVPRHQLRDESYNRGKEDRMLEQNHNSQMKRQNADEPGKTQGSIVTKTGTKTGVTESSRTRNTVKPLETKGIKNKTEAVAKVSVVEKSKPRREAGVRMNMGGFDVKEVQHGGPAVCSCKLQDTQTVTRRENTASLREKRNAQKSDGKATAFR